jgi:hypothetical protein
MCPQGCDAVCAESRFDPLLHLGDKSLRDGDDLLTTFGWQQALGPPVWLSTAARVWQASSS